MKGRKAGKSAGKSAVLKSLATSEALPGFLALVRRATGPSAGSRHLKSESTQRSTEFKRFKSRHKGRLNVHLVFLCTVAGNSLSAQRSPNDGLKLGDILKERKRFETY